MRSESDHTERADLEQQVQALFDQAEQEAPYPHELASTLASWGPPTGADQPASLQASPSSAPSPSSISTRTVPATFWLAVAAVAIVAVGTAAFLARSGGPTEIDSIDEGGATVPTVESTVPNPSPTDPPRVETSNPLAESGVDDDAPAIEVMEEEGEVAQPSTTGAEAEPADSASDPGSVLPVDIFPNGDTTGFRSAGLTVDDLIPSDGLVIEESTVIDGLDIQGSVIIAANDVTIRNSRITSSGLYTVRVEPGVTGTVIEQTEIVGEGGDVSAAVFLQSPARLSAVSITGGRDNIKGSSGLLLEESLLSQATRTNLRIRQGSDIVIRANTIVGTHQAAAVIILDAAEGPIDDVVIEANLLSGGNYTVSVTDDGFDIGDVLLRDNRVVADSFRVAWLRNDGGAQVEGNETVPR